jgi:hypothetical protein
VSSPDDGDETFADVLNGLTLTGPRPRRHAQAPAPSPVPRRREEVYGDDDVEQNAASVRAYAWTGGRTRSDHQLEIETLVTTSDRAEAMMSTMRTEHQSVARLCYHTKSVAEVGALLRLPLGVARVLLGDMASLGLITVHRNATAGGEEPDLELLERVLHGLTNLRPAPAPPAPAQMP